MDIPDSGSGPLGWVASAERLMVASTERPVRLPPVESGPEQSPPVSNATGYGFLTSYWAG